MGVSASAGVGSGMSDKKTPSGATTDAGDEGERPQGNPAYTPGMGARGGAAQLTLVAPGTPKPTLNSGEVRPA